METTIVYWGLDLQSSQKGDCVLQGSTAATATGTLNTHLH